MPPPDFAPLPPPDLTPDPDPPIGPPADSHLRRWHDWQPDPWAPRQVNAQRRAEKHRRWIAAISPRDWAKLDRMVEVVRATRGNQMLNDGDAPFRIGVFPADQAHYVGGEPFGTVRGTVLLAWPKTR